MKKLLIGVTEAALIGLAGVTITQPATAASFNFDNFSNVSGLTLNGSAQQVGNVLRLTPASAGKAGSAFITTPIALGTNTSFNAQFQFQISNPSSGGGADGFTFTLQNAPSGPNALGAIGGFVGYGGITPSLAVAFKTFNSDNVSVVRDGSLTPLAQANSAIALKSGVPLNAFIDYDGTTQVLNTYLSETTTKPNLPLLSYIITGSLPANVYAGFTGGTGGAFEAQDIQNFQFSTGSTVVPGPSTGVPEPSSALGIIGLGAIGVGYKMKRQLKMLHKKGKI